MKKPSQIRRSFSDEGDWIFAKVSAGDQETAEP